jgi:hypothetical protein
VRVRRGRKKNEGREVGGKKQDNAKWRQKRRGRRRWCVVCGVWCRMESESE